METNRAVPFRQVRGVGDVINATFSFIRQEFVPLAKALLFIAGPAIALGGAAGGLMQTSVLFADPEALANPPLALFGVSFFVAMLAGIIGGTLAVTAAYGYMVLYQDRGLEGSIPVPDVWTFVRANFFRMLGTLVLWYVATMAAYFIALIPMAVVVGVLGAVLGNGGSGGVAIGVVMIIAVVLVALFAVAVAAVTFGMTLPMRMREQEVGAFEAVGRSLRLVKGHWWATLGVAFVVGVAYFVFAIVVSLPTYAIIGLASVTAADGGATSGLYQVLMTAFGVVSGLAGTVLYALPLYAIAFQYFNLVERKERTGLMERVEAVHADAAPDAPAADASAAGASASGARGYEAEARYASPGSDPHGGDTPGPDDARKT